MIRVVLDTNVLLSGFVSSRGAPARVLNAWRNLEFELVLSEPILDEFRRNLLQPYFRRRLSPELIDADLDLLHLAEITPLSAPVHGVASHAEDDLILATAASAEADYLVTGDKQLLALGAYKSTRILTAADFLAILEGPDASEI